MARYRFGVWLEMYWEPLPEGVPEGKGHSDLDSFIDEVMERLIDHGVEDPSIGGSLADGTFEVTVSVDAPGPEGAVEDALGKIRAAIHAAEGGTPDWPQIREGDFGASMIPEEPEGDRPEEFV